MSEEVKIEEKSQLNQKASEVRETLRKHRFDLAMSQLDDVSKIKKAKKELARILTRLSSLRKTEGEK